LKNLLVLREQIRRESQYEFAKFLGVAQATIHHWETGKRTPSIKMLQNIAAKCNVSISFLLDEGGKHGNKSSKNHS
jgi:transcriptional regulator with XRE-family HTH domain